MGPTSTLVCLSSVPSRTETRRGVDKLLQFSGHVGGLSEDDVLAVLRESGITTLEALIQHALAVPPPAEPQPLDPARILAYTDNRPLRTAVIDIPDMERIGWNDRISSVEDHGPIRR
ncbi:hypothetical protein [Streptosporangium sp. NPDC000396]|uniref:hypothetical protein n=1 Tax=Streptosporangium sp. NPDC000396 TaxID=3366185 RepID=UPI0036801577